MSAQEPKPRLLLVDDSEDDVFFFKRTLERVKNQCSLHCASNGEEAIQFLKEGSASVPPVLPSVVFLDLKMPIVNGFEVLEWLKHQQFGTQLSVIVLSGSESWQDKERAQQLGAKQYLVKPIRVADLSPLLAEACPSEQ
jgi:CheY-like chemotaxis protein